MAFIHEVPDAAWSSTENAAWTAADQLPFNVHEIEGGVRQESVWPAAAGLVFFLLAITLFCVAITPSV